MKERVDDEKLIIIGVAVRGINDQTSQGLTALSIAPTFFVL